MHSTTSRRIAALDQSNMLYTCVVRWGFKADIRKVCITTICGLHSGAGQLFYFPQLFLCLLLSSKKRPSHLYSTAICKELFCFVSCLVCFLRDTQVFQKQKQGLTFPGPVSCYLTLQVTRISQVFQSRRSVTLKGCLSPY